MPRFLNAIGYLPSAHPLNVTNNYAQGFETGQLILVAIDEIVLITDVLMEDVLKDCKIFVCKSSSNENEKKTATKEFAELHGQTCAGIKLRGEWHVYLKCTSETVLEAIEFMRNNPSQQQVQVDDLPSTKHHIDVKA